MLTKNKKMSDKNYFFKNYERNLAFNSFLYHNREFFNNIIETIPGCTNVVQEDFFDWPGIYMEKGQWKWGSQGLQNWLVKNEYVVVDRTDYDTCCLTATPKLVNKILKRQNNWNALQANY